MGGQMLKVSGATKIDPPDGESVVGIANFRDTVYVATTKHVYFLDENFTLQPIPFIHEEPK